MNPQQLVIQIATGYIASTALYLAARLDIASRLAGGSKSVAELAAATGVREDALYRVLRLSTAWACSRKAARGRSGRTLHRGCCGKTSRTRCTVSLCSCPIRFISTSTRHWTR